MNNSFVSITPYDLYLHKQNQHKKHIMLRITNREFRNISTIQGEFISGNISIDANSNIRHTGSLTMNVRLIDINKLLSFDMDNYIRVYCGTTDNRTQTVQWYLQGTFIVNSNGFNFDKTTRTLSLSLSDPMYDLTGDRAGVLHEYSTIVKNSQRIDRVMKNVLQLGGVTNTDITPISLLRDNYNYWDDSSSEQDYLIPYDLEFGAGVTIYEILEKLVGLYPNWEIFYDNMGKFICQRSITEEDSSYVVIEDQDIRPFVLSEDTTIDYAQVKNWIEVWGKDGHYYGEAKDETTDSPFNVHAHKTLRAVFSGGNYDNIYDRYKDPVLQDTLLVQKEDLEKEIGELTTKKQSLIKQIDNLNYALELPSTSENIASDIKRNLKKVEEELDKIKEEIRMKHIDLKAVRIKISMNTGTSGDIMAKEWAKQLLYENCRLKDSITIQTILLPFFNDVNFKISYRSKADNKVRTYIVKSVSHDLTGNTTTLNLVRFYAENCTAYHNQLSTPVINNININGMEVVASIKNITGAEQYNLYIDYKLASSSTGTTLIYELPEKYHGEHIVTITASGNGYRESEYSEPVTLEFVAGIFISTSDGDVLVTSNNDNIEFNEG